MARSMESKEAKWVDGQVGNQLNYRGKGNKRPARLQMEDK